MSGAYWLGVITTPLLALLLFGLFVAWVRVTDVLARRGITFETKRRRDLSGISDYVLQHDIWWERQHGPVFSGGWYREEPVYESPSRARVNRWVGIGSADGPCLMAFHSRDLGDVT